jgi:hypothetical protein
MTPRPAKSLLVLRGISQRHVARTYGCAATFVNDCLSGRLKPPPKLRAHVAALLELDEATVWPEFQPPIEEDPGYGVPETTSRKGHHLDRSSKSYA